MILTGVPLLDKPFSIPARNKESPCGRRRRSAADPTQRLASLTELCRVGRTVLSALVDGGGLDPRVLETLLLGGMGGQRPVAGSD